MRPSRLHQLLQTFTKKERREFARFVRSPFFNENEKLAGLLDLTLENLDSTEAEPSKEETFSRLASPRQPFDPLAVRRWMSELTRLAERFLALREAETDPDEPILRLAAQFRRRKLGDFFARADAELASNLAAENAAAAEKLDLRRRQLTEKSLHLAASDLPSLDLQPLADATDAAWLAHKLRLSCSMLAHAATARRDYDFGALPPLLDWLAGRKDLLEIPAIGLYFHCFRALSPPESETEFSIFREKLLRFGDRFPQAETRDLFTLATNFCIRQQNKGSEFHRRAAFELFLEGLRRGYLLENGQISQRTYHNISALGMKLRAYDETEKFARDLREAVEPKFREALFALTMARLEFARKNFSAAAEFLQLAPSIKDPLLQLAARTILLKIYLETDDFDALDRQIDSTKSYLERKRLPGNYQKNYQNIVRLVRQLSALNIYDREAVNNFRATVAATEPLTEKEWFLERLG